MLPTHRLRAFTLVELIVVILVLGILAGVAVVGYSQMAQRASDARAKADLRQLTTLAIASTAVEGTDLSRATLLEAMADADLNPESVEDGLRAAGWQVGAEGDAPLRAGQVAVGFDNDDHVVDRHSGSRAALVVGSDSGQEFAVIITSSSTVSATIAAQDGTTPTDILGATTGVSVPPLSGGVFIPGPLPSSSPTPSAPVAPSAPVLELTAAGGQFTASWPRVDGAALYRVAVRVDGGEWVEIVQAGIDLARPLAPGTSVTVRVQAHAAGGLSSPWSPERTVTAVPGAATLAGTRSGSSASLTFSAAGASEYQVLRSSSTVVTGTFSGPNGMAVDAEGNVFIADTGNARIRKLTPDGLLTTYAGTGAAGRADGDRLSAQFSAPSDVAFDSHGNLFVADSGNNSIRKITPDGRVSLFAGLSNGGFADRDGTGTSAAFSRPSGLAIGPGDVLYVADTNNHKVRKVTSAGVVTTFAGSNLPGSANGPLGSAAFNTPSDVAIDANGTYLYVTDSKNNAIRRVQTSNSYTSTVAGGSSAAFADGTGTAARFNYPGGVTMDAAGNIIVADQLNRRVRQVTPLGKVTTIAGTASSGSADGPVLSATFKQPISVVFDRSGDLLISDTSGSTVRQLAAGQVTTIAGNGTVGFVEGSVTTTSDVEVYSGAQTAFTDSGLATGTTYTYRVVPRNETGAGASSRSLTLK